MGLDRAGEFELRPDTSANRVVPTVWEVLVGLFFVVTVNYVTLLFWVKNGIIAGLWEFFNSKIIL